MNMVSTFPLNAILQGPEFETRVFFFKDHFHYCMQTRNPMTHVPTFGELQTNPLLYLFTWMGGISIFGAFGVDTPRYSLGSFAAICLGAFSSQTAPLLEFGC